MPSDHSDLRSDIKCPCCHGQLEQGFIPTGGGMHWFRKRDASSTDFAEHIPGTHAWLRSARLPAWRCRKCQCILFRYGENAAVSKDDYRSGADHTAEADESDSNVDNG